MRERGVWRGSVRENVRGESCEREVRGYWFGLRTEKTSKNVKASLSSLKIEHHRNISTGDGRTFILWMTLS